MKLECESPIAEEEANDASVTDQERLDEAMLESFPASDPPSWNAGISHEQAQPVSDDAPERAAWERTKRTLMQACSELTDEDFICGEGEEAATLKRIAQKLHKTHAEVEELLLR